MSARWRVSERRLDAETARWHLETGAGDAVSFGQIAALWRTDADFRSFWSGSLRDVPFDTYCWECPPVTAQGLARPFECVFIASPLLSELPADPEPFAEHFRADREVVVIESLGKDALLVAPCPAPAGNFAHLASFLGSASDAKKSALWKGVGDALADRVGAQPLWLSTAGLGVSWLHVRLDSRPKYYRHAPYKLADQRLR